MEYSFEFEAEPVDMKAWDGFWAVLGQCVLKGKTWRLEHDPWEGFVLDADEHRLLLVLSNMSEPGLEIQAYIGRALVAEDVYEQLAQGVCFIAEFKFDADNQPVMEFRFPLAYSS